MMARFIEKLALVAVLGAFALPARAQTPADLSPLFASQLPPAKFFASTDPQHQNHDFIELKPGETRRVKLAAGQLVRLWSTATAPETLSLSLQRDAQTVPLLKNGRALQGELHAKAFTFYPRNFALPTNAQLVATNGAKAAAKWFYQATVRPSGGTAKASSTHEKAVEQKYGTSFEIAPGQELNLSPDGGAVVWQQLDVTPDLPSPRVWQSLRLRARYGGRLVKGKRELQLGIDVPLLAFTGQFTGANPANNALCRFDGRTWSLRAPLPFSYGTSDSVSLFNNDSASIKLKWRSLEVHNSGVIPNFRLYAAQGSTRSQPGAPIPILRVKGAGAFVGLAMDVRTAPGSTARSFAFLEGNETLKADGRTFEGTGTEDFFNAAWYFPNAPFAQDFGGMTFKRKLPPAVAAYRWMIPDAVPFKRDLAFDFEHDNGNRRADLEYRWVAFWYQASGGSSQAPNTLPRGANPAPRRATANSPANGTARADWRFMLAATGLLMAAIAAFFVRRHVKQPR